jgi:hypothetical protein
MFRDQVTRGNYVVIGEQNEFALGLTYSFVARGCSTSVLRAGVADWNR